MDYAIPNATIDLMGEKNSWQKHRTTQQKSLMDLAGGKKPQTQHKKRSEAPLRNIKDLNMVK